MTLIEASFVLAFLKGLGLSMLLPFDNVGSGFNWRLPLAAILGATAIPLAMTQECTLINCLYQFVSGALLAMPLLLLLAGADFWGDLVDSTRGQTLGSVADPLFQSESSYFSNLSKMIVLQVLVACGALEQIFKAYFSSLSQSSNLARLFPVLLSEIVGCLRGSMLYAIPAAIVFILCEIAVALSARLLPNVSLSTQAFTIKMAMSLLLALAILQAPPKTELLRQFLSLEQLLG